MTQGELITKKSSSLKSQRDKRHYARKALQIRKRVKEYYRKNRIAVLAKKREQDRKSKQAIIDAFGGKCVCCGEDQFEFLTVDHIKGDGHAHRKRIGRGRRLYNDILKTGCCKNSYRLLCFNCNISRGFYGYCPHHPEDISRSPSHAAHKPGRPIKIEAHPRGQLQLL